ncbi:MAG: ATP-binding protein [Caldilineaceae bacterium]
MNRFWVRLSLYFCAFALFGALLLAITARVMVNDSVRQSFLPRQLEAPGGLVETLHDYYQLHRHWDGVGEVMSGAQATFRVFGGGLNLTLADGQGNLVYRLPPGGPGENGGETGGPHRRPPNLQLPIEVDGAPVGYLQVRTFMPAQRALAGDLLQELSRLLIVIALGGALLGVVFSIAAGRTLTAPLTQLASAARAIGAGNLSRRVAVTGSDEVIEVATAFNEMAAQLETAEQLRRNLVADVAHELRTPLTVIQGNLQAILDEVYPLDKEEIARLYTHTRLLNRLVNDLHELAQAEAGQLPLNRQSLDLNALIQETVDAFAPMADEADITVASQLASALPPVWGDAARLAQVLHNLLANAIRYTPAGGLVTIQSSADQHVVQVAVTDTGEGLAPEHLAHIFDRFYRTDKARARHTGGAGLGLAIVRAIVVAHGGQVTATSPGVGQGSTFTMRLPIGLDPNSMGNGVMVND